MCDYSLKINELVNSCKLGLHGGSPSNGVCAYCMSRGENTPEHAAKVKTTPPSLPQQTVALSRSIFNWGATGFMITPPNILEERFEVCRACPEWDANGLAGTGRCKKCGCSTQAKLRMATEKCPLDKWGPVTSSSPKQQPNTN